MGDWKEEIDNSYNEWKHSKKHQSIKKYFSKLQETKEGEKLKQDSNTLLPQLNDLAQEIERKQGEEDIKCLNKENGQSKPKFLGKEIDAEYDPEVEQYAQDTLFGGFWKTMKKLLKTDYLSLKTVGDVLKKLLKKLVDFMEAGLQSIVVAIGFTIGHIVSMLHPLPELEVHEELGILCVQELDFINYGETVQNRPKLTFFPKTVDEIQRIIRYGKTMGRRVRCAGMKHSWSHMFSDNGEILVYLLPLTITDTISFTRNGLDKLEDILREWNTDLSSIQVVSELEDGHAAVRVGAATTNLEMLNWSNKSGWTLPLDIIAVMITYGGSNAMICHGAGLHSKTLSDLVLKLEFIDANGEYRTEDDPDKLKALGGCFGLAGIVTYITLKMDTMTYARFQPKKTLMKDSIPRPGADPNSDAFKKMVELCSERYYVEFFWFPSHGEDEGYWENCWNNDGRKEDAIDINIDIDDHYQVSSTYLFEVIMKVLQPLTMMSREEHYDDETSLQECLKYIFSKTVSMTGHNALPEPKEPATTSLVEALHFRRFLGKSQQIPLDSNLQSFGVSLATNVYYFRRGFHYIAVREMEMEIPIPSLEDGSPDWTIVSRAWWDAVDLIQDYEKRGIFAVDMALELRIMGGSDVLMASQYGNKHGTLAIEPVSTRIVDKELWEDFKVELAKVWMNYRDFDGSLVKSRVHWAKESPREVIIGDEKYDTIEYWQRPEVYGNNMTKFFDILSEYNNVEDIYKLFSNSYLDVLFKPQWERFGIDVSKRTYSNGDTNGGTNGMNGDSDGNKESKCCTIV